MTRKNILFLFTDQQRYDTIEAHGNPIIKTPALNQLVETGVTFTRAYSSCPVCVPARYAMMTGQLPHRTDCTANERMPEGRHSFMEILSQNGYQTHGVGKMHFTFAEEGAEALWGFESRDISEEGGGDDDFKRYLNQNGYEHVHDPQGVRSEMYYIPQPSQLPAHLHNTTWVVDRSIDFLERRDRERPFLLMSSFIKPHPPFETPTPWNKLYRALEMSLPKRPINGEELLTYWNRFQNRYKYRDQGVDDHLMRAMKAAYYCTISFIDYQIGRLLAYMEEHDLLKNTMIVFSSDHAELLGDYNSVGKRSFLDSAARIPLIVVDPDRTKGNEQCHAPVGLVDILPTFLQAANIEPQEDYSGRSLLDIAEGKQQRELTIGQYNRNEFGVYMAVAERYKYIYSAPDNKEWLFDLQIDPEETHNFFNNPMYKDQAERMKRQLLEQLRADQCTSMIDGDDWRRYEPQQLPPDRDALLLLQDPPASIPCIPGYERNVEVNQSDLFRTKF
ncbi:sulfatase family protein [Paenibacillus sp. NRS-1760]|uniref:sulfatase family protein n=1 Tax=Paenibacillus sp. NRS-1760 TaxID=3233902 RepID=UPI003D2A0BC1